MIGDERRCFAAGIDPVRHRVIGWPEINYHLLTRRGVRIGRPQRIAVTPQNPDYTVVAVALADPAAIRRGARGIEKLSPVAQDLRARRPCGDDTQAYSIARGAADHPIHIFKVAWIGFGRIIVEKDSFTIAI